MFYLLNPALPDDPFVPDVLDLHFLMIHFAIDVPLESCTSDDPLVPLSSCTSWMILPLGILHF
jgi:hypothetical protein